MISKVGYCLFLAYCSGGLLPDDAPPQLFQRNREAPFCYLLGGERTWPILDGNLKPSDTIHLIANRAGVVLAEGQRITHGGLDIAVKRNGRLWISANKNAEHPSIQLLVRIVRSEKTIAEQTIEVRPAPPPRPISYLSDLVDDLIRIFWDGNSGRFRPIEKSGLDQYFRRLQAHGVNRLIVWQSPFPFTVDPRRLSAEDWSRYKRQAQAILNSEELTRSMAGGKLQSWKWLKMTMRLRLTPEFGRMLNASAAEHGIKLTASFRPFEPALTKYYETPAFDEQGKWLWGFLPAAWPKVNYHADRLCFANFRTILKKLGRRNEADVSGIEFSKVDNADELAERLAKGASGLRIVASHFPPIATDSFVLVRDAQGNFALKRYRQIAQKAESHQIELRGFDVSVKDDVVSISNLRAPDGYRFLIVSRQNESDRMIVAPLGHRIVVRSRAGNRLGRANVYRCLDESDPDGPLTRIAGITSDGGYRTTFQAAENSLQQLGLGAAADRLAKVSFVVDLGADWSVEMLDFQQRETRQIAIDQLKTFLSYPAYDEIFVNTRSHTQLAATMADGLYPDGPLQPLENYRLRRRSYRHLGLDLAFGPISLASSQRIRIAASKADTIEQITDWQEDEWNGPCQSPDSPFVWRYERNRAVAAGLRMLFQDLEREFPGVRIRAVIPPSEKVIRAVQHGLDQMPKPNGDGNYGRDYYRHLWGSLNYIPNIGEGMAMVDLSGLSVEPVFLGIRYAPDTGPLDLYLREWFADMAGNRGSAFRGPRSFFYEAQETLRPPNRQAKRKMRKRIICQLLEQRKEINEVVLYEAADWTYYLPLSDADQCGHGYLDRCTGAIKSEE